MRKKVIIPCHNVERQNISKRVYHSSFILLTPLSTKIFDPISVVGTWGATVPAKNEARRKG